MSKVFKSIGGALGLSDPGKKATKQATQLSQQAFGQTNLDLSALTRRAELSQRINAGGLSSGTNSIGQLVVVPSAERLAAIGGLDSAFTHRRNAFGDLRGQIASNFGALRSMVVPGFGKLSQSIRDTFGSARSRAIGDLRENLARRRVAGSSFAADALSRAEAEFAMQEGQALAEANINEIGLSRDLLLSEVQQTQEALDQETAANANAYLTHLNELNLETEVATRLAEVGNAVFGAIASARASLASSAASAYTNIGQIGAQSAQSTADRFGSTLGTAAGFMV